MAAAMKLRLMFLAYFCFIDVTGSYTIENLFEEFIIQFKKPYSKHSQDYYNRLAIFKENIKIQNELNNQRNHNYSARYGVTKFSDITNKEFKDQYLLPINTNSSVKVLKLKPNLYMLPGSENLALNVPLKVDWRKKGVIAPVLNQKSCGSCWAFTVTETIESSYALKNGTLPKLSVQEMMDCSYGFSGALHGCKGGDTCTAFDWMQQTQTPLVPDRTYPLTDKPQACKVQPSTTKGVKVQSYTCNDFSANEKALLGEIAKAPVAVAVDATMWNNYLGGIIQFHCGEGGLNHAVQIVGYDANAQIPYYIVKNSWGTDWGHDGYAYIRMGNNVCDVATRVSMVETFT